jgi:ribosomal protein S27AE
MSEKPTCPRGCEGNVLDYVSGDAYLCAKCGITWSKPK